MGFIMRSQKHSWKSLKRRPRNGSGSPSRLLITFTPRTKRTHSVINGCKVRYYHTETISSRRRMSGDSCQSRCHRVSRQQLDPVSERSSLVYELRIGKSQKDSALKSTLVRVRCRWRQLASAVT